MNFGQPWRTEGVVEVRYEVEVPQKLLHDLVGRELPEYIEDCIAHPDPESSIDRVLRAAGWPSAADAMMQPDLKRFLAGWFAHDLLLYWFGDGPPEEEPGFVLNTIDEVDVAGNRVVTIGGLGRTSSVPVRYQDE